MIQHKIKYITKHDDGFKGTFKIYIFINETDLTDDDENDNNEFQFVEVDTFKPGHKTEKEESTSITKIDRSITSNSFSFLKKCEESHPFACYGTETIHLRLSMPLRSRTQRDFNGHND